MGLHKIARDYYYSSLTIAESLKAGYFQDNSKEDYNLEKSLNSMSTPIEFIRERENLGEKPAILFFTGCFAPLHEGHRKAVVAARNKLLQLGYTSVFAYFCPAHDEYVRSKTNNYPIDKRVDIIRSSIKEYDWMRLDLWPALFRDVEINFTEALRRFELYIKKHLGSNFTVFYLCGADNARFSLAFKHRGNCVVVGRPEAKDTFYPSDSNRILWVDANINKSSTSIRLTEEAKIPWPPAIHYTIRLNSIRDWIQGKYNGLAEIVDNQNSCFGLESIESQKYIFDRYKKQQPTSTISLDPCIPGDYNLEISRRFDWFGMDFLDFVERPGSRPISEQLASIPKGNYILFDDDIHSGGTVAFVTKLLASHGVRILKAISFTSIDKIYRKTNHAFKVEILDGRDFLEDEPLGGLVMGKKDSYKRYPYKKPYLNTWIRASIPNKS